MVHLKPSTQVSQSGLQGEQVPVAVFAYVPVGQVVTQVPVDVRKELAGQDVHEVLLPLLQVAQV